MSAFQTFWITAGLIAVAAAMYRMGSIVSAGKEETKAIKELLSTVIADLAEHKRDVTEAFREVDARLGAHEQRLGAAEERGGAISRLIEKQAHLDQCMNSLIAVCAERHENSLRIELDERGVSDSHGIPKKVRP